MFQIKAQKNKLRRLGQNQTVGMVDQVKKLLVNADQRLILMVRG
ncbi:MAG: hypothetical protein Q7R43_04160 [Candidatus Daviesbacteria bacterium]|nr:hypothetical protein [Candidatus Daviesbacteria bacterium]